MNTFAKLASAIAAVAVIAIVGYNLLPGGSGVGGPQVTSSPSAPPAPTATPATSPTPAAVFPPVGQLAVGRHTFTEDDLELSLAISSAGWVSEGYHVDEQGGTFRKGSATNADAAWVVIWSVDGVYTDPCAHVAGPVLSGSPAELAAAVAGLPGATASGPTDTTIDGYPATHVTLVYGTDAGCDTNAYYLWYNDVACGVDDPCHRWLTASNSTLRVWIVDVGGTHFWIEAETYDGASAELDQEIRDMVASIQFE